MKESKAQKAPVQGADEQQVLRDLFHRVKKHVENKNPPRHKYLFIQDSGFWAVIIDQMITIRKAHVFSRGEEFTVFYTSELKPFDVIENKVIDIQDLYKRINREIE